MDAAVKVSTVKPNRVNCTGPKKNIYKRRTTGYHLKLRAPIQLLIKKLAEKGFCTNNGFPTSRKAWTVLEDRVIVSNFNAVLLGLLGYYSGADNQNSLRKIQYILQYSCAMTLGHKHRKRIPYLFRKFGKKLTIPCKQESEGYDLHEEKSSKNKSKKAVCLKLIDFSKKKTWRVNFQLPNPLLVISNNITKSKLGFPCCICESTEKVEMHHVKHVRKADYTYKGFHELMHLLSRKQIPVCKICHLKIHKGEYDGIKLEDLKV